MTWNGKLGFETRPSTPIDIAIPDFVYANAFDANDGAGLDGPQGIMGIQVSRTRERWTSTIQAVVNEFRAEN